MSDHEDDGLNMFDEPADFYEPEKEATFATHKLLNGDELTVRLVGHSPLWGHHLWHAATTLSTYLEQSHTSILPLQHKSVLELGAGAGLPSLTAALHGASPVVVTDYPDADLIANLRYNIAATSSRIPAGRKVVAEGYLWGADPGPLLAHLDAGVEKGGEEVEQSGRGFDVLILADLLFNHSEHGKLLKTVQATLRRTGDARALVFFTPHRPWLLEKDLDFFRLAEEGGLVVEKVGEWVRERVMFEEDRGDELLRRTVFGYEMRWKDLQEDEKAPPP
ncbi:Protein N-terminal and lysine N-methyltransferase efm7 [Coniosporium apollinis]|uniref:Protein N-terminal and lysine N-methyltransferase EFM7 n=1 Tax=Coniosporium apollinis TaxID=61459 RepID=A0ABQ9NP18_9PEZI|nr:Protein N-terminal and lysine N-methyltransferase efm7 [Coniosporium apollinis]